ncbi:MAG TPA: hypothetical protein DCK83_13295 [Gallionellaceae bacterium]|nr:hypothetical protein [Gallionellaceae bacterium]
MGPDPIDAISDPAVLTRAFVVFLAIIFMFAGNFKRFRFLLLLADFLCREWMFRYGLLVRDIGWLGHIDLLIMRLSGFPSDLCRCEGFAACSKLSASSVRQLTQTRKAKGGGLTHLGSLN